MMPVSHVWQVVLFFVTAITIYLFYLYTKDRDKRKLLFALAFLFSIPSFFALAFGFISVDVNDSSVFWFNVFTLSSLPMLYAVFIASHEPLLQIKKYDKIFKIFLIITAITLVFLVFPSKLTGIPNFLRIIVSFEILAITIYQFIKTRGIENLYFIGYITTTMAGGIGFSLDYGFFSSFAFLMGYIFICFLFISPNSSNKIHKKGINNYFSLEQQLKTAEKRYEKLFDTIPDAITLLSEDGTILNINETMAGNFHTEKEEIIGKNMHQLLPDDVDRKRTIYASKALQTGKIQENDDQRDGYYFHNLFVPIKMGDDQKNLMVIARNVTKEKLLEKEREDRLEELRRTELATLNIMDDMQETLINLKKTRKELEQKNNDLIKSTEQLRSINQELDIAKGQLTELNKNLEEKVQERTSEVEKLMELKDSFIYQLSHDLKTPLTPLIALLPIIKEKTSDPETKKSIDICIDKVRYMKLLVTETLDLAKLNSPSYDLKIEKTDLHQFIDTIIRDIDINIKEQNIKIDNKIPGEYKAMIDPLRFTELIHNLISNAIKYSPDGGNIIIHAEETKDDLIKISITDQGIGLTTEQLNHIFDEFYKADESRHDFNSTGLGLTITKQIVEKHGGTINATSDGIGKGSTFSFTVKK